MNIALYRALNYPCPGSYRMAKLAPGGHTVHYCYLCPAGCGAAFLPRDLWGYRRPAGKGGVWDVPLHRRGRGRPFVGDN